MTGVDLIGLGARTVTEPRDAAREVLNLPLPRSEYWNAFLLVIVLAGLLQQLTLLVVPTDPELPQISGFMVAAFIGGSILLTAATVQVVGRWFGGQGRFEDALLLMIWLQYVLIGFQVVQLLLMMLLPPAAGLVVIFGFVASIWILVNFIAELHGFESLGKVFLGVIGTAFGIAFALALVLGALGVSVSA